MERSQLPDRSSADLVDAATAAAIYRAALESESDKEFFDSLAAVLSSRCAIAHGRIVARSAAEGWREIASWGRLGEVGADGLSEVLDRGSSLAFDDLLIVPLAPRAATGELLVARASASREAAIAEAALALGIALQAVRRRQQHLARSARLQELLAISSRWNQSRRADELLVEIAEAATRFLGCQRASIFLWDKPRRQLVGRPALGVEGGELRIPDTSGVVGRVVRSGLAERVDRAQRGAAIDRQTDRRLGFTTETVLCVPLRIGDGPILGAFEAINKIGGDFTPDDEATLGELVQHAAIALAQTQEREQLAASTRQIAEEAAQGVRLIGEAPAIEALRSTIRRVAETDLAVLVLGENGSGKEVVAQSIHYLSHRRDRPFIAVNCAALSETLLESELFGHEKGAFTDAREARAGKFELAAGGTLFLDEIGDLSPAGQAKLLRVLEEKVVVRVGGSKPVPTDARVVAATNQPLVELVRQKRFRQDLYFRLNVVTLDLPPLRERPGDALVLARHFLNEFSRKARRTPPTFTAAASRRLASHAWPGNVRELRNLMERMAYLHASAEIDADDLALAPAAAPAGGISQGLALSDATDDFQRTYIDSTIAAAGGNVSDAARRLGLHRSNLYRKMRQLGMQPPEG